ncbi:hypothetical protein [Allokutzneria albata]|uniref:hypothetical protein n=1 Tax=Allokutzneria albata TaxID=211114 RepID=UPI0012F798F3|nr:hypothetical protein [Allokutzneria albata]
MLLVALDLLDPGGRGGLLRLRSGWLDGPAIHLVGSVFCRGLAFCQRGGTIFPCRLPAGAGGVGRAVDGPLTGAADQPDQDRPHDRRQQETGPEEAHRTRFLVQGEEEQCGEGTGEEPHGEPGALAEGEHALEEHRDQDQHGHADQRGPRHPAVPAGVAEHVLHRVVGQQLALGDRVEADAGLQGVRALDGGALPHRDEQVRGAAHGQLRQHPGAHDRDQRERDQGRHRGPVADDLADQRDGGGAGRGHEPEQRSGGHQRPRPVSRADVEPEQAVQALQHRFERLH